MVNIYSQELSAVTHTRLLMKHFKAYGHLAPSFECVSAQTQPGVEQLLIIIDKGKWNTMLITAMSMQCITTAPVQLPCHCWLIHLCLCAVLSVVWLCVCVQSCVSVWMSVYYECSTGWQNPKLRYFWPNTLTLNYTVCCCSQQSPRGDGCEIILDRLVGKENRFLRPTFCKKTQNL